MAPTEFTFEQLREFTDNFNYFNRRDKNLATVYTGLIDDVEVDVKESTRRSVKEKKKLWEIEKAALEEIQHPNIIKLIGYGSCSGYYIVYEHTPNTLENLFRGGALSWRHTLKILKDVASALQAIHEHGKVYGELMLDKIVIDWDGNAKLTDLYQVTEEGSFLPGSTPGFGTPEIFFSGKWSKKSDVFAFGLVLLGLIAKRGYIPKIWETSVTVDPYPHLVDTWARKVYKRNSVLAFRQNKSSLVHKSLTKELGFSQRDGLIVTKLGMQCLDRLPKNRPTMKQVIDCLLNLHAVKFYGL